MKEDLWIYKVTIKHGEGIYSPVIIYSFIGIQPHQQKRTYLNT